MTIFDKIKTAAIARLEAGEDLDYILQDYADYEEELRPILEEISGASLGNLASSPKSAEKPKIKGKRTTTTNWQIPAIAAVVLVILFFGGIAFYQMALAPPTLIIVEITEPILAVTEPILIVTEPVVEPTDIPFIVDPITSQSANDACASLNQQRVITQYDQNEQASQTTSIILVAPEVEEEVEVVGLPAISMTATPLAFTTPSPLATMEFASDESSRDLASDGRADGDTDTAIAGMPLPPVAGEPESAPVEEMIVVTSGASPDIGDVAEESPSDDYDDDGVDYESDGAYDEGYADSKSAPSESRVRGEDVVSSSSGSSPVVEQVVLEALRAGEIDDNADWDTYQEYRHTFLNQFGTYDVRDIDTTDRQVINVLDNNGLPVYGACVEIYRGDYFITASRTYATGLTLFFPNLREETRYADNFRVVVTKGQITAEETLERDNIGGVTTIELDMAQQIETVQLDVLFLLDATGSMSDEIAQLQENILAISAQVDALDTDIDVRYSLVTYRDFGDDYVTRVYDFTSDVNLFQNSLAGVVANGGGDYPEAMSEGLDMALNAVNWRSEDAVKLIFLVADAPPHIDYQNGADYIAMMQDSLARGIKIHPIASSGLQPEGEFIMRQVGQYTMGHFIFLTYEGGVSGTAGDDRPDLDVGEVKDEQGVGDYSVSQLDELVLRLITDEINALRGE